MVFEDRLYMNTIVINANNLNIQESEDGNYLSYITDGTITISVLLPEKIETNKEGFWKWWEVLQKYDMLDKFIPAHGLLNQSILLRELMSEDISLIDVTGVMFLYGPSDSIPESPQLRIFVSYTDFSAGAGESIFDSILIGTNSPNWLSVLGYNYYSYCEEYSYPVSIFKK